MADAKRSSMIKIVIAVIALAAAGGVVALTMTGNNDPTPQAADVQYFYDVGAKQLFEVDADVVPPIAPPSEHVMENGVPGGVKAHVFSCGRCDPAEWYIGYLETYTVEAAAGVNELRAKYGDVNIDELPTGEVAQYLGSLTPRLVARADLEGGWIDAASPEAAELRTEALRRCDSGPATPCYP